MRRFFLGARAVTGLRVVAGTTLGLLLSLALPCRADRRSDAREQFERAVRMRTMLEGLLEKDRTLADYKQTIAAYHKVYLLWVRADEVTPSLIAEGELYQEMGRLFDPKYFQSAIDTYNFLLQQFPGSRYRGTAMLSAAHIEKDDLNRPDAAETAYKAYLKQFPRSENASEARAGLKEIAAQRAQAVEGPPAETGERVEPRVSENNVASVKDIRTWNAQDSTRVVVTLDDTIEFEAARIASPDRIYFDIYKARLGAKLANMPTEVKSGLLKSMRIAPNKPGVVRLVLDVNGAKDYSAFLLSRPYRLVIDVHAEGAAVAKSIPHVTAEPAALPDANELKDATRPVASPAETMAVHSSSSATPASTNSTVRETVSRAPAQSARKDAVRGSAAISPPSEPKPTRDGERSLTRALGLKIGRIVLDPGHGGYDTGTIGPHGLMEKDLCLDVALRLGTLIEKRLPGTGVVYTRKDDTFVPLQERTQIANEAKADLFISIHANSSHDPSARGVETYYLNFATSPESMEVATRENASSDQSLHDLQDLIQKIARNEKIEESKELAGDIQDTLAQRLQLVSRGERNRGVKKAPFVVLIGANMPSVLSEISFVSNPSDERLLRKADQRQRIADGLYRGIASYLNNLNSLSFNKQKLVSDNRVADTRLDVGTIAPAGNPK